MRKLKPVLVILVFFYSYNCLALPIGPIIKALTKKSADIAEGVIKRTDDVVTTKPAVREVATTSSEQIGRQIRHALADENLIIDSTAASTACIADRFLVIDDVGLIWEKIPFPVKRMDWPDRNDIYIGDNVADIVGRYSKNSEVCGYQSDVWVLTPHGWIHSSSLTSL
jgi:hypothetical protein